MNTCHYIIMSFFLESSMYMYSLDTEPLRTGFFVLSLSRQGLAISEQTIMYASPGKVNIFN